MDGLSVKVFRTYNASITLDRLLWEPNDDSETVEHRKADYDRANKEVGAACRWTYPRMDDHDMIWHDHCMT